MPTGVIGQVYQMEPRVVLAQNINRITNGEPLAFADGKHSIVCAIFLINRRDGVSRWRFLEAVADEHAVQLLDGHRVAD